MHGEGQSAIFASKYLRFVCLSTVHLISFCDPLALPCMADGTTRCGYTSFPATITSKPNVQAPPHKLLITDPPCFSRAVPLLQLLLRYFFLGPLSTLELLFRLFRSPLGPALTSDELFLLARRLGGDADLDRD